MINKKHKILVEDFGDKRRPSISDLQREQFKKIRIRRIIQIIILILIILGILVFIVIHYVQTPEVRYPNIAPLHQEKGKYYNYQFFKLNEIQMKGSHNSYEIGDYVQQIQTNKTHPFNGGCVNVEIDIIPQLLDDGALSFDVGHTQEEIEQQDNKVQSLQDILQEISAWHEDSINEYNIKHQPPILITLDLKNSTLYTQNNYQMVIEQIDNLLLNTFNKDKIFTPKQFVSNYTSINEAIQEKGYPYLSSLMGKFIFIISGAEYFKDVYDIKQLYSNQFRERVSFVDIDARLITLNNELSEKFVNIIMNYYQTKVDIFSTLEDYIKVNNNRFLFNVKIQESNHTVSDDFTFEYTQEMINEYINQSKQKNLLSRGWQANNKQTWNLHKDLGLNIITTDRVYGYCWTIMDDTIQEYYCHKAEHK